MSVALKVWLHWPKPRPKPRQRPRPMALGSMMMLGRGYTEQNQRLMQIYIGSVHILSVSVLVSVPVSDSVNEPLMGLESSCQKFTPQLISVNELF